MFRYVYANVQIWMGLDRDIFCHLCQCSDMFFYRYGTMLSHVYRCVLFIAFGPFIVDMVLVVF